MHCHCQEVCPLVGMSPEISVPDERFESNVFNVESWSLYAGHMVPISFISTYLYTRICTSALRNTALVFNKTLLITPKPFQTQIMPQTVCNSRSYNTARNATGGSSSSALSKIGEVDEKKNWFKVQESTKCFTVAKFSCPHICNWCYMYVVWFFITQCWSLSCN